ncbi:copper resistance CopC family protein [Halomonas sp. BM-2019]|uniref:copper resistance CopC family protein n=1 Tax=Halomonas sp. BM-2019 TaxID=2811227 RepID=UPI001B3C3B6A|nr:MAG: copper resistance protein CopC [Halomonas sp. BM-2019]
MIKTWGKQVFLAGGLALLGLVSQPLWAHAHLIDQVPAEGEVVAEPPEQLELRFDSPIRITQFEVHGPQGEIALSDGPVGEMGEHHEAVPADVLAPGEYRVTWRGLAEDGHTMSGDFRFTVDD